MVHSSKKKILSLLLSLCMIVSMISVPMMASATSDPVYPVVTSNKRTSYQVVSPDFFTFPAAAGSSATNPTTVDIITATPGQQVNPADFTPNLVVMDSTFTYTLSTTINSTVGTQNADGSYSGGTTFYAKVPDPGISGTYYYYKVVAISPNSTDAKLGGINDSTDLSANVTSQTGSTDSGAPATISLSLKSGKSSFPQSAITTDDSNASMAVYTDSGFSSSTSSALTAGTYYLKITAQDGTTINYFKLIVSAAASSDASLAINEKNAIVSGTNSATNSGICSSSKTIYVNLAAGTYIISNLNNELFNSSDSRIGTVTTKYDTDTAVNGATFSKQITTGDTYTVTIPVTAADTTTTATYTVIYKVFQAYGIYTTGSGLPSGATCPLTQFTNDSTTVTGATNTSYSSATPIELDIGMPIGVKTISSLAAAFSYTGYSIDFASNSDFSTIISSETVSTTQATIYARVKETSNGSSYVYYKIVITPSLDTDVAITQTSGSAATVADGSGNTIQSSTYNGKITGVTATQGSPFAITVTVNAPAKLKDILASLTFSTANVVIAPTYTNLFSGTNPYLTFGESATVTTTATSEDTTTHYYTITTKVVSTSNKAEIASIASTLGTATIVAGNLDPSTPSVQEITAPTTVTAINASAFTAADYGTFKLYANATDMANQANSVSYVSIPSTTNSAVAYATVTSGNTSVTKYYEIVVNKTDTTKQYALSAPATFTKSGSNFVATVTVDRATAAKLTNPKLYVVYTLADGKTQTYQTLDLSSSDTTVSKDIVVGAGFKSVMAFVVNGTVDWSQGLPDNQSNMITISVQ